MNAKAAFHPLPLVAFVVAGTTHAIGCGEGIAFDPNQIMQGSDAAMPTAGGSTGQDAEPDEAMTFRPVALPGCDLYPTSAALEQELFGKTCADEAACHKNGRPYKPNLTFSDMEPTFLRLLGKTTFTSCLDEVSQLPRGDRYIDFDNYEQSLILRKTNPSLRQDEEMLCKDGKPGAGIRMPYQGNPLTASQYACLRAYVKALAGQ